LLTFAAFMAEALYAPKTGYYRRPDIPLGRSADFVTAPEHHPAFAHLVGRRVVHVAHELRLPQRFTVVEMGAGCGTLAAGIAEEWADTPGIGPLSLIIIEPFPEWRGRQQARLAGCAADVSWCESLADCPEFTGVFVSNELPDAFPVHRVVRREAGLRELWVVQDGSSEEAAGLKWHEGPVSTLEIEDYFRALALQPALGHVVELSLELAPWARAVSRKLRAGSFLTIDYGATAEELFLRGKPEGSLRAYRNQRPCADPLAEPGLQDLTADVDFSTLIRTGVEEGLALHAFTTQRQFLLAMGWRNWLRRGDPGGRRALTDLVDPLLMGRTRVCEMVRRPA
jgi:SAM-dependent MidA family methyltransferase